MCTCGDCQLDCQESLPVVMNAFMEASLQSRVGDFHLVEVGAMRGPFSILGPP